nr:MBL fold metallo-hydrolase [Marinicella sp. W31]MDC2876507.1 MBL fold metallo-hydrolase [Marinicella sp. W31]
MKLTWLGHSAFRIEIAGATILIDPFLSGNPSFEGLDKKAVTEGVTHILLTHGHSDHLGDTVPIARETGATVLANADLAAWLGSKGSRTCSRAIQAALLISALSPSPSPMRCIPPR